jgi:hypothetical protein
MSFDVGADYYRRQGFAAAEHGFTASDNPHTGSARDAWERGRNEAAEQDRVGVYFDPTRRPDDPPNL